MNWSRAIAAVALTTLAAACGSSTPKSTAPPAANGTTAASKPATTPAARPAATRAPDLQAELLSLSDLPTGWTPDNSPQNNSATPQCLVNVKTDIQAASQAEARFQDGSDGLPDLDENLAYLPGKGKQAMAFISQTLGECGQISFTSAGHTFTGTIGAMSSPPLGDQSSAYQINMATTVSGVSVTAGIDLAAIRKGDTVALIFYGDIGTPDVQTFQQFAQDAAAKLS